MHKHFKLFALLLICNLLTHNHMLGMCDIDGDIPESASSKASQSNDEFIRINLTNFSNSSSSSSNQSEDLRSQYLQSKILLNAAQITNLTCAKKDNPLDIEFANARIKNTMVSTEAQELQNARTREGFFARLQRGDLDTIFTGIQIVSHTISLSKTIYSLCYGSGPLEKRATEAAVKRAEIENELLTDQLEKEKILSLIATKKAAAEQQIHEQMNDATSEYLVLAKKKKQGQKLTPEEQEYQNRLDKVLGLWQSSPESSSAAA